MIVITYTFIHGEENNCTKSFYQVFEKILKTQKRTFNIKGESTVCRNVFTDSQKNEIDYHNQKIKNVMSTTKSCHDGATGKCFLALHGINVIPTLLSY